MTDAHEHDAARLRRQRWATGTLKATGSRDESDQQKVRFEREFWSQTTASERFLAVFEMAIDLIDTGGANEVSKRLCRTTGGLRKTRR